MPTEHRCKFCPTTKPSYRELRKHCELNHPRQYASVTAWLGKTVHPRLEAFERLANEGMHGQHERVAD